MANAEVLKIAHDIDKKVEGVEAKMQTVIDDGQQTAYNLDDVKSSSSIPFFADGQVSNTVTGGQLRECLRKWQSPPDPSTSHNIACECQHEGTAKWFCQGNVFEEWKVAGSLLWIHGKRTFLSSLMTSVI